MMTDEAEAQPEETAASTASEEPSKDASDGEPAATNGAPPATPAAEPPTPAPQTMQDSIASSLKALESSFASYFGPSKPPEADAAERRAAWATRSPAKRPPSPLESSEEDWAAWSPEEASVVFTAYFEGTANVVERRTTQIGLFHELDRAVDVGLDAADAAKKAAEERAAAPRRKGPLRFKCALNGCGHEHGLAGVVFAYGLRAQCEAVADVVKAVRAALGEPRTQLNVVGLSRGAVAALAVAEILGRAPERFVGGEAMVDVERPDREAEQPPLRRVRSLEAQRFGEVWKEGPPKDGEEPALDLAAEETPEDTWSSRVSSVFVGAPAREPEADAGPAPEPPKPDDVARAEARALARRTLRLHLLLFDPVPGNQVYTTQYMDPFRYSTGNQAMDVSACEGVLRRVLAVYPYEPLPAITFHAPLVPRYPARGCHVDEVASLGCHQGAVLCAPNRISCRLSYAMLRSFLANESPAARDPRPARAEVSSGAACACGAAGPSTSRWPRARRRCGCWRCSGAPPSTTRRSTAQSRTRASSCARRTRSARGPRSCGTRRAAT